MDKIFDFLLFLAEIATITFAIMIILGFALSKAAEGKEKGNKGARAGGRSDYHPNLVRVSP